MSLNQLQLSTESLDDLILKFCQRPLDITIVIFESDHCPHCKNQKAILNQLQPKYHFKIYLATIAHESTYIWAKTHFPKLFTPTMIIFRGGKSEWLCGFQDLAKLARKLEEVDPICLYCAKKTRVTDHGIICRKQRLNFRDTCSLFQK